MKERPVLPSSESFTTRQDLQGKFSLQKRTEEIIFECLRICWCKECALMAKDAGTSDCWVETEELEEGAGRDDYFHCLSFWSMY